MKKTTFKLASLAVLWSMILWWSMLSSQVFADDNTTTTTKSCETISCKLWTKKEKQEKFYLSNAVIKIIDEFVDKVDWKAKNAFWSLTSNESKKYVLWIYEIVVEKFYNAARMIENDPELAKHDKTPNLVWVLKDIAILFNVKWNVLNWTYLWDHYYYNNVYKWDSKNNYNPNESSVKVKVEEKDDKKEDTSKKNTVVFKDAIKKLVDDIKAVTSKSSSVDYTLYDAYVKNLKWETLAWYEITWNHVLEIWNEAWHKIVNSWESAYDFSKLLNAWSKELNFVAMFWAKRNIDVVNSEYALLKKESVDWRDQSNQETKSTTALKVLNNFDKWFFDKWEWYLWFAPFNSKSDAKEFMDNQNISSLWYLVKIWSTSKYALFFNPFDI